MPTPDQRNYYYTLEAERTGVHRPLLAALYTVQQRPNLLDDDTGLGISPANKIAPNQVNTFPQQVQFAANTIRSLLAALPSQGWGASDLWDAEKGRYTDKFMQQVALGYTPVATDPNAALLESSNVTQLLVAYSQSASQDVIQDASQDLSPFVVTPNLILGSSPTIIQGAKIAVATTPVPRNLSYLDPALLTLIGKIPEFYQGLDYQRQALLEGVRVWRRLDTIPQAIASLLPNADPNSPVDETQLFNQIRAFLQRVLTAYGGFPQEREALIRLTQLWRELPSREQAIASLQTNTSPEPSLRTIDPALINFTYNISKFFVSLAPQRNALIECVRLWRQLETRADAVKSLGIDPDVLNASAGNNAALTALAAQLDKQLVAFTQRIPKAYKQNSNEREAMIRLVQLWRNLPTRAQTLQSLINDLKQIQNQKPTPPPVVTPPNRPPKWTLNNIQQSASIIVDGSFTWAEATKGGSRMPPDQETLEGMIRIARLGQRARDRVGRPFIVTSWYRDPVVNAAVGGVSNSRHINGDAIDFYCDGLTGDEIYWILDPWWPSGLGRYIKFPFLCHIDARDYRARWQN